jgi:hypothetical protein
MCSGGRLLADFTAGGTAVPDLPTELASCLTRTADGRFVVWAYKVAHRLGAEYLPITGGPAYPADAIAACKQRRSHTAPQPGCTCGFHAVSVPWPGLPRARSVVHLDVALSGRVLALEWPAGGVLFRAERQTVLRRHDSDARLPRRPDAGGRLARSHGRVPWRTGPARRELPVAPAVVVELDDDAGFCWAEPNEPTSDARRVLATA